MRERERSAILLVKLIAMAVDKARLSAANDPLREDYRSCGTTISPSPSRNTPRITLLLLMLLLLQRRDRDVDGRTQLSHSDEILFPWRFPRVSAATCPRARRIIALLKSSPGEQIRVITIIARAYLALSPLFYFSLIFHTSTARFYYRTSHSDELVLV